MTDGRWSAERVLSLATDASSARAARGLARPEAWTGTGTSARALWGAYRGTSPTPYQVAVDLTGPAFSCTCPSRKNPCKHALALLLLWPTPSAAVSGAAEQTKPTGADSASEPTDDAAGEERSDGGGEPGWVRGWLEERDARAEQGAGRPGRGGRTPGRVADPEAAKARAERRAERVASGVAELRTWLGDRVRRGLGGFEQNGYSELNRLAARMVDAQAPGLAGALRQAASNVGRGQDWPGRLLEDLAMIHVLAQAHERLDELPAPLAESVRTRIGWSTETARVQAEGERVTDTWLVLGRVVELDERLTTRRIWLRGTRTGRTALLLTFAPAGQYLDPSPAASGERLTATLAYYPAAHPLRALLIPTGTPSGSSADSPGAAGAVSTQADMSAPASGHASTSTPTDVHADGAMAAGGRAATSGGASDAGADGRGGTDGARVGRGLGVPGGVGVEGALDGVADVLAVDPWVERVAVVLAGVRPGRYGDGWALVDADGDGVDVSAYADPWPLLAVSAGGPVTVAGEWSRGGLLPMTCWHGGRVVALT